MTKLSEGHTTWWQRKSVFSLAIFFALLVVLVQGGTLFPNGQLDRQGNLVFYDRVLFRDSTVHLSLISEMQSRFPPTDFSAGGVPLRNYHYIYDSFLALIVKVTRVSPLVLYFQIAPVAVSLVLSLVIYLTVWRMSGNKLAGVLAIFFTVFGTSLGPMLPFIKRVLGGNPSSVTGGNNIFMTDQLMGMLVNPQGVVSLVVFLSLFLLLSEYLRQKKNVFLAFFALILGLSFGIKAYGGIVFAPAAILAAVGYYVSARDWKPLAAVFAGLLVMLIWILWTIDSRVAGVSFAPFWIVEKMVVDINRINEPRFYLLAQHYMSLGRYVQLTMLVSTGVLVYLIGSLGLRIIGFVEVFSRRRFSLDTAFLFIAAAISFVIPLLFNQSSKAYDIVQFTPYFTVFMGLMFTMAIFQIGRFRWAIVLGMVVVFLLLDRQEVLGRLIRSNDRVAFSKDQLAAIEFVREKTSPEAIFVLEPSDFNLDYLWFPALAGRRTYFSGIRFAEQVGVDTSSLRLKVGNFLAGVEDLPVVKFAYLPASTVGSVRIEGKFGFRRVYDNREVVILERI